MMPEQPEEDVPRNWDPLLSHCLVESRSQGTVKVLNSSGAGEQLTADPTSARQPGCRHSKYEVTDGTNINTCAVKGSEKRGIFSKAQHDYLCRTHFL